MAKRSGLGRGLDSIIPTSSISNMDKKANAEATDKKSVKSVKSTETTSKTEAAANKKTTKNTAATKNAKAQTSNDDKTKKTTNIKNAANATNTTTTTNTTNRTNTTTTTNTTNRTNTTTTTNKTNSANTTSAQKLTGANHKEKAAKTDIKMADGKNTASIQSTLGAEASAASSVPANVVAVDTVEPAKSEIMMKLTKIEPNRNQPRKEFDEDALQELAESIKNHGIIQPLIVRKVDNQYEIVAGERRWRAARLAGLKEVPVVIKEYTDSEMAEIALVENLQRENLNPIEEAMAYQRLLDEFALKQEEVAFRVSKSRSVITNSLRLLKLHPQVQEMLAEGKISTGHGKVILGLETPEEQLMVANMIVEETLSVRQTEDRIRLIQNPKVPTPKKELANQLVYQNLEDKIRQYVNTKVVIHRSNEKKGKIEISYDSLEELERIVDVIGVKL